MNEAIAQMQADIAGLVAAMKAKGHEKAEGSVRVEKASVTIWLNTNEMEAFAWSSRARYRFEICRGVTYDEALVAAYTAIEAMDVQPEISCAAWFDMSAYAEGV